LISSIKKKEIKKKESKNMKNIQTDKILMIKNPFNGKMTNMYPIFEFLSQGNFDLSGTGGQEGYLLVDSAIRSLAINFSEKEDVQEVKNGIHSLYQLRDAFEGMKEL